LIIVITESDMPKMIQPKVPDAQVADNVGLNPRLNPPYIPWKTFEGFASTLCGTHPPDMIDSGVMPDTMAGGLQRQLRSALKFLGLTNGNGRVEPGFVELIAAYQTPQWPSAVKETVLPAYASIIGDLPIERATAKQLDDRFRENCGISGQMLDKAVRFYLHALKAAEAKYSRYWSLRKETRKESRKRTPKEKKVGKPSDAHERGRVDHGAQMIEFPLHFGDKPTGKISVPTTMDEDDMALFDATVAVIKAYATRKRATPAT
jgi:hypothetical protein